MNDRYFGCFGFNSILFYVEYLLTNDILAILTRREPYFFFYLNESVFFYFKTQHSQRIGWDSSFVIKKLKKKGTTK